MEEEKRLEEGLSEKIEDSEQKELNDNIKEETSNEDISNKKESDAGKKEEEYYFTAADLRKQKKRAEQRKKRMEKEAKLRNRNVGRMYKSSAIIAVFAGIMQIIMGLPKEDGMTNIMLGATFICFGYLFYNMGTKADKEKKKQEENR